MNPVIIEDTQSIAANTTVDNVIVSNTALRGLLMAPFPCRLYFLAVQSATGLVVDGGRAITVTPLSNRSSPINSR